MPTIHNPSNFQPQDYTLTGYFDNQPPEMWFGQSGAEYGAMRDVWHREIVEAFGSVDNSHRCSHCGNGRVRYVVAAIHKPTGAPVCFGTDCVERLNFSDHNAFKAAALRKAAATTALRLQMNRKAQALCEANPALKLAVLSITGGHEAHKMNGFAQDIVRKLFQYGSLSDRQQECLINSVAKDMDRFQNPPAPAPEPTAPAPEGRQTVEGTVVFFKVQDSDYGTQFKMLVLLDSGSKVWCTAPSTINSEDKGKRIRLTATFEHKQGDRFFAFGKRPKAEILEAQPA